MPSVEPLVSADWLVARLGSDALRIIDIRSAVDGGGSAAYEQAHVPGAIHTDYARDGWRCSQGMATGMLPDAGFLADLFGQLGVTPARHVVIVSAGTSAGDFSAAARVYWTFKIAGHDAVSLLDGGMAGWHGPVEAGRQAAAPAPTYPVRLRPELRSELDEVAEAIGSNAEVLLDSRSTSYFEGREKSPQAKRGGRLPHAVHLDHTRCFDAATKRLKPAAELAALFASVPQLPVVNYCNTGHQAATNWFVLSEILHRPSRLYDGSMSQWTEDEQRPVEVG